MLLLWTDVWCTSLRAINAIAALVQALPLLLHTAQCMVCQTTEKPRLFKEEMGTTGLVKCALLPMHSTFSASSSEHSSASGGMTIFSSSCKFFNFHPNLRFWLLYAFYDAFAPENAGLCLIHTHTLTHTYTHTHVF